MPIEEIIPGREYLYARDYPPGCQNRRYRVEEILIELPSNQHRVLVECLEGSEKGLRFVCSPTAFAIAYDEIPVVPEKVAGHESEPWRMGV